MRNTWLVVLCMVVCACSHTAGSVGSVKDQIKVEVAQTYMPGTFVVEDDECHDDMGSYIPGTEVGFCLYYDHEGWLIGGLDMVNVKDKTAPICGYGRIYFVKCLDKAGMLVWPQETTAPICPFTGDKPSCP